MDALLKGDTFNFFIDEIFPSMTVNKEEKNIFSDNLYGAVLIPNIKSSYFPPMHLRRLLFPYDFLTVEYYQSYREKHKELPSLDNIIIQLRGSIKEGNYYEIPSHLFPGRKLPEILTPDFHNVFEEYRVTSPFSQEKDRSEIINLEEGNKLLHTSPSNNEKEELLVYCFNVGQGDSILIIFPNKNVYIVDTNIYSKKALGNYISAIKQILSKNGLPINKIKALVITHKHLDHLRGAEKLIESTEFQFDHFLINFDYSHETNVVKRLLDAAKRGITNNINVNKPNIFSEGSVTVTIANPKHDTCNNRVCNDLNDTSIVLLLKYGESSVLLSGDASFKVLNCVFSNQLDGENMLKISHHGSRTGTNDEFLNKAQPKHAFISAGNHKGFGHPHSETIAALDRGNFDFNLSRDDGSMVYRVTANYIDKAPLIWKRL